MTLKHRDLIHSDRVATKLLTHTLGNRAHMDVQPRNHTHKLLEHGLRSVSVYPSEYHRMCNWLALIVQLHKLASQLTYVYVSSNYICIPVQLLQ